MEEVMHPSYLPFPAATLAEHFIHANGLGVAAPHLAYYTASLKNLADLEASLSKPGANRNRVLHKANQLEKDERFWAAAVMGLFHDPDRTRLLAELLRKGGLGERPPFADSSGMQWEDCLEGDLALYFEAVLPSPPAYGAWLRQHLPERCPIPHLNRFATAAGVLEGSTHVDAAIINRDNGFTLLVEAKVLSDVSGTVSFDLMRNQLARTIDVMLDANTNPAAMSRRLPHKTCLLLLTPEVFREHPRSRLYGHLYHEYRDTPARLGEDLPHRQSQDWTDVAARLGWATFEDCESIRPGTCAWLHAKEEMTVR